MAATQRLLSYSFSCSCSDSLVDRAVPCSMLHLAARPHLFNIARGAVDPPHSRYCLTMRVLVITGAGVSAESGIPTFRGKDGYWRNWDPAKLATRTAFQRDPNLVWDWYRERRKRIRAAQPNPAHEAIARLAATAGEFLLVTQEGDDLHVRAKW